VSSLRDGSLFACENFLFLISLHVLLFFSWKFCIPSYNFGSSPPSLFPPIASLFELSSVFAHPRFLIIFLETVRVVLLVNPSFVGAHFLSFVCFSFLSPFLSQCLSGLPHRYSYRGFLFSYSSLFFPSCLVVLIVDLGVIVMLLAAPGFLSVSRSLEFRMTNR